MDLGVVSVRYARALLKSAVAMKLDTQVYADMQMLTASYINVPQLRFTIDNPMLAKEQKQSLLEIACGKKPAELSKRFIALVLEEGRENALQLMANSFVTLYRQQKNITRGRLITATVVSPETEAKMKQMVETKTQGTVEFETEINPDLIGGFILEYDTYRMDSSVKSKLNAILSRLKK